MVTEERGELRTPDGCVLSTARWTPSDPKGVILLVHGHAEHLGRYGHVVDALTARGYVVVGQDHRGHGKSGGERALAMRFDDYVDDFRLLAEQTRDAFPQLPVGLVGHSMGGLIAARYALRYQHDLFGVALSGAAFVVDEGTPAWQRPIAGLVARVVPKAPVPRGASEDVLSYNPAVKEAFQADPLNWHGPTRIRTAVEMVNAGEDALRRAADLTIPLLAMHGEDDRLTSQRGTIRFYEAASSPDKTLKIWPHMKHEIFNEVEGTTVIGTVCDWLDAHIQAGVGP